LSEEARAYIRAVRLDHGGVDEGGEVEKVIDTCWMAMGIDEAWEEQLALAVNVLSTRDVSTNEGAVDNDCLLRQNRFAIKDTDVVESHLRTVRCHSILRRVIGG